MSHVARHRSQVPGGLFLSVLSGALLALSFPKFNLEFLAWLALIPLFSALKDSSRLKAFLLSFSCGLIFWVLTLYWLVYVTVPGTIVLILYLALYFGVFGLIVRVIPFSGPRLFLIPAMWVLLEYLRSQLLTGFPWALLGYSQYLNLPAIQIADIFGAWGVSFLMVMVNCVLYSLICHKSQVTRHKSEKIPVIFACVLIASVFVYGFVKLRLAPNTQNQKLVKISVIQGNIPQELKWYQGARQEIMEKYTMLSRLAAQEKPDLIVWPEAAVPVILEEEPAYYEMVRNLAKQVRTPLLFGAVTSRESRYYNSALMVSAKGEMIGRYDKLHLVPFGEYIPLRKILPFLETIVPIGDVSPGKEYTLFNVNFPGTDHNLRSKFGVLICFEDVFPGLSRQFTLRGAQFLVNITNDAWYQHSFASYQHFQASVFRAVENRISLLRSANTGVSGFISPEGKIISLVQDARGKELFVDGFKLQSIPPQGDLSIYTRFGDWFIIGLCFLIVVIFLLTGQDRRRREKENV
jgi:apolipoprotein N-acyltransferase